jgi:hypothetical protein
MSPHSPIPEHRTVPRRPTRAEIAAQDCYLVARQAAFRRAADAIAVEFAKRPEVRAVTLFGSVARPLLRGVTRFQPYRTLGIKLLHECADVDIAIRIDRIDNLAALNRARTQAVANLLRETGIGVAHHQVDIFLFGDSWDNYLGRLCTYGQCPKDKVDCLTPGCGRALFLKQHEGFVLWPDALAADRGVPLYERGRGCLSRAADLDTSAHDPGLPEPAFGAARTS